MVLQLFVQFQIARQEHIQRGGGFGDEAAALVEDGLFEGVASQTAVAGGAGVVGLTAGVVVPQRLFAGLREGVALVFCEDVGDLQQLVGGVVRELDLVGEAVIRSI